MHEFSEQPWLTEPEAQALHARALNLLQAGQDAAGAEILLALALARPDQAVYFRDLGLAWHRSGAWDKAWEAYGVAHTLDPHDDVAAALRAECAVQVLSAPEALDILKAVLARPNTAAAAPYLTRARQLRQRMELRIATDGDELSNPAETRARQLRQRMELRIATDGDELSNPAESEAAHV